MNPRRAIAGALWLMCLSAASADALPSPPPLCSVVQRFLDEHPPSVLIIASCTHTEQRDILQDAGLLVSVPATDCASSSPAYRLTAKGVSALDDGFKERDSVLEIPVGRFEALSETQCGLYVQYSYRMTLNNNGRFLLGIPRGSALPITPSLPHGVTLGAADRALTEVVRIGYNADTGWDLDVPRSLGWPGTYKRCADLSAQHQ